MDVACLCCVVWCVGVWIEVQDDGFVGEIG